jgi:nucleotide-binding universal stress UspA family protein
MTILVAYVPRPEGRAALDQGIEMAKRLKEDLVVVNTSTGAKSPAPGLFECTTITMQEKANSDDDSVVTDEDAGLIERELAASGVTARFMRLTRGKTPVEELEALVTSLKVSLLIIGLRKRSPVGKFFLGSIAQEVLLSIPCPILSIKAR